MNVQTTPRVLLGVIFRQQRMIIGLALSILGTVLLGSLLQRPQYEASSSILIRGRSYQQDLLTPEQRREGPWTVLLNAKEEVNSEIAIIRSRPVLERVVQSLKLDAPREIPDEGVWGTVRQTLRDGLRLGKTLLTRLGLVRQPSEREAFEAAVERLGKRLRIEPSTESQVVWISYRDPDPVMASRVTNAVTEEYRRQHLAINLNQSESGFYAEQITQVEGELKNLQDQLIAFKSREGILSFSEQSTALLRKVQTLDVARTDVQKEIISKRSKVERIRDLQRSQPNLLIPLPEIAQDVQIQDLENKLVNLRYEMQTLRQRYTEDSRQAVTAREELADLTRQLRQQVNEYLEREVAELSKMEAEEQALAQTIRGLEAEIKTLPAKEVELDNLEDRVKNQQETLAVLRKKYQDSLVTQATDFRLENAKVVSPASVPLRPVTPNVLLNAGLGLVLALVVSFSLAFLIDYWDDSLKAPEDFELHFQRPVFASIPEL
ncbi:MAG TPA: GumC family protein [Candidatus Binatia bacterium]|nr:GumC family protein [Candidatus Binatia bacterium]